MSEHPIRYTVEVAGFTFLAREVKGREALSHAWRVELAFALDPQTMLGDPDAFDPDEVLKAEAHIVLERGDDIVRIEEVRRLTGVVTDARLSGTFAGVPEVVLVIEPRFALLRHRRDIRIHRNLTVPEIVTEVATALGVKVEQRLRGTYPSRPYCVQFRESDYDYCNRLLEDEGIFYFFVEPDTLVLADNVAAYQPISGTSTLMFRAVAGLNLNEEAVHEIGSRAALTPGTVTLRDWNTEHPSLDMDVSEVTNVADGPEWYDFPGEYEEPTEGARKAALHREAFDRLAATNTGAATSARLFPGVVFTLANAPVDAPDGEYVIRAIDHAWNRNHESFVVQFEADPATLVYRPERHTHVPTIFNPMTGIVCTPGDDIHCDHFGRVKVHFHWDRLRPYDDDCSHWVPVLQDNTGTSSAIPRKDWEMVVHFLEGDPDRPMVMGRVYNAEDPFTEKLPMAKYRSGLKSMTTPERLGSNEIRFDDMQGGEQIYVHAQKDQNIRIANNRTEDVWNKDSTVVKNDETINIGNDATWSVGDDMLPTVKGNQTWEVSGNRTRKIGKCDNATVTGDHTLKIGGNHERKIFLDDNVSAKSLKETIGGSVTENYKAKHNTEVGKTLDLKVGGAFVEVCKESKNESTTSERTENISGLDLMKAGREVQMRFDETRTTQVAGSLFVNAAKELTLTGAEKFKSQSTTAAYNGSADITLKVGDTVVLFKGGLIKVNAPKKIALLVGGANNQGAGKSTQI